MRHLSAGTPFLPGQEKSVWLVEARVDFDITGGPISASLSLPDAQPPGFELFDEQAASPGYGFTVLGEGDNRRAEWTKRDAKGEQSLYYSAQLVESDSASVSAVEAVFPSREYNNVWENAQELAAREVLGLAREKSSSPLSLTRELIKLLNSPSSQNAGLLRSDTLSQAELLIHFLTESCRYSCTVCDGTVSGGCPAPTDTDTDGRDLHRTRVVVGQS